MEAVGNWMLKVDLEEVCFATLKDKAVIQIVNAINFEEIKATWTVIFLRNEAMATQLPDIVEKGPSEDGEVDERDCLMIRG
jgi:hypothetical protein